MASHEVSGALSLLSTYISNGLRKNSSSNKSFQELMNEIKQDLEGNKSSRNDPAAILNLGYGGSQSNPFQSDFGSSADRMVTGYAAFISSIEGSNGSERSVAEIIAAASFSESQQSELSVQNGTNGQNNSQTNAQGNTGNASSISLDQSMEADMQLAFDGSVKLEDGTEVEVSAQVQVHIEAEQHIQIQQQQQQARTDPLALDVNGDGTVSVSNASNGIAFDINGDGQKEQTAFVNGSDVFLALDKNGNGKIDDGTELFGDQNGAKNGFLELARYDDDKNGVIDAHDSVFNKLQGVRMNAAGSLESVSLDALGVKSISLQSESASQELNGGSLISDAGSYMTASGKQRAFDVLLSYQRLDMQNAESAEKLAA